MRRERKLSKQSFVIAPLLAEASPKVRGSDLLEELRRDLHCSFEARQIFGSKDARKVLLPDCKILTFEGYVDLYVCSTQDLRMLALEVGATLGMLYVTLQS